MKLDIVNFIKELLIITIDLDLNKLFDINKLIGLFSGIPFNQILRINFQVVELFK